MEPRALGVMPTSYASLCGRARVRARACVRACVRVCVRARVRACVRARVCVRAHACAQNGMMCSRPRVTKVCSQFRAVRRENLSSELEC
jgi:hypothetical protein